MAQRAKRHLGSSINLQIEIRNIVTFDRFGTTLSTLYYRLVDCITFSLWIALYSVLLNYFNCNSDFTAIFLPIGFRSSDSILWNSWNHGHFIWVVYFSTTQWSWQVNTGHCKIFALHLFDKLFRDVYFRKEVITKFLLICIRLVLLGGWSLLPHRQHKYWVIFMFIRQVMMGGAWFEESFGDVDKCDADAISDLAVRTVADHLNIHEPPFRVIPHVHKVC